jgi:hypothetical protein
MGSKAEYEAKKAAKRAKRAAEEAAKRQAVIEGCVVRDVAAPAGDDQEIRYEASLAAETAAYEAAGLAKLTPQVFMTKADPIGGALLSQIFPEHRETHTIGFCVTVEPGRVIAQRDHATDDEEDSGYVAILIRGSPRLEVGEVVHAGLYEPAGKGALRCIKRVLYPHLVLPDGWREAIPTEEALWADEDLEYTEFFGIPVGELIYGPGWPP